MAKASSSRIVNRDDKMPSLRLVKQLLLEATNTACRKFMSNVSFDPIRYNSRHHSRKLESIVRHIQISCLLLIFLLHGTAHAQDDGFESLFSGKDLTGWSYLPTTEAQKEGRANWQAGDPNAPPWPIVETKINFDQKVQSADGRFVARDGVLVVSVPKEGRKVQMLYSDKVIKGDFVLQLEFRAANNADSGVFIRGKQLQCRDYPNAGPYKNLKAFKSEDWNKLKVVVTGETARCTCNGELLEDEFKVPTEGPIGVEDDRGKFEYRNIRFKQTEK
jgi:hypothetical protein